MFINSEKCYSQERVEHEKRVGSARDEERMRTLEAQAELDDAIKRLSKAVGFRKPCSIAELETALSNVR